MGLRLKIYGQNSGHREPFFAIATVRTKTERCQAAWEGNFQLYPEYAISRRSRTELGASGERMRGMVVWGGASQRLVKLMDSSCGQDGDERVPVREKHG